MKIFGFKNLEPASQQAEGQAAYTHNEHKTIETSACSTWTGSSCFYQFTTQGSQPSEDVSKGVFEATAPCNSLANFQNNFTADQRQLSRWINQCLTANLTYYRSRREFFTGFVRSLEERPGHRVDIDEEDFITVRQFLTSRNDMVTQDARLAFDKSLFKMRASCANPQALSEHGTTSADSDANHSRGNDQRARSASAPGSVQSQSGITLNDTVTCSEIDGLTMSNATESTGVTTMLMEACTQVEVLGRHHKPSPLSTKTVTEQNLTDYFSRPVYLGSINTFTLGTRGLAYFLDVQNFGTGSILARFNQASNRLMGVYGIKYKIVFTLFVAASPFHQGVICMNWQYGNNSSTTSSVFMRASDSATSTNLPHAKLDLSETTMCQLSVPFLAEEEFHPINTSVVSNSSPYGMFAINTLLPIPAVSGIAPPTFRIMLHLEDIELIGARPISAVGTTVQSGLAMNKEFLSSAYPFSSGLHLAGTALGWVSKGIPALSTVAGPASWLLGKAAGVARYFGYSKPQIQDPPMRCLPISSAAEHNIDLPSATLMVAPFSSNSLRVGPDIACSDVDEMALAYVLSQWSQICVGSINTSTAAGTAVYTTPVSPSAFWFRTGANVNGNLPMLSGTAAGSNAIFPSNLLFWASLFRKWRGGIKFRFTFSKTKLHGGRLITSFNPDSFTLVPSAAGTYDYQVAAFSPFADSVIFDLRDGSTFEFTVPYIDTMPYSDFMDAIGTLVMYVQEPLQAPGVVSSSIGFMVEVCACPDFELSNLRGVRNPLCVSASVQVQSGLDHGPSPCETVAGECFTSAKQLIMLPKVTNAIYWQVFDKWRNAEGVTTTVTGMDLNNTASWGVMPWWFHPKTAPSTGALPVDPSPFPAEAFSLCGNIAKCYAFARGSTDVHVYALGFATAGFTGSEVSTTPPTLTPSSVSVPLIKTATLVPHNLLLTSSGVRDPDSCGSNQPAVIALGDTPLHVRFPSYLSGSRGLTTAYDSQDLWINAPGNYTITSPLNIGNSGSKAVSPTLPRITIAVPLIREDTAVQVVLRTTRSAGDDAQLGHYMGPPPMAVPRSTANITTWSYDNLIRIVGGVYKGGGNVLAQSSSTFPPAYVGYNSNNPFVAAFAKTNPIEGLISSTATVVSEDT